MTTYVEITPNRPDMEPLPATDRLFQFENGTVLRMRVTIQTTEGAVLARAPEPGEIQGIAVKFRCSICKDDSGDVLLGSDGNHLVLPGEVHTISFQALATDQLSFDGWREAHIQKMLEASSHVAHGLERVLAKHPAPAQSQSPRVTMEMHDALLQRVAALEAKANS